MKTVIAVVAGGLSLGIAARLPHAYASPQSAQTRQPSDVAVGSQYDSTHVYVAPQDLDRFVTSVIATFGGTTGQAGVSTVTPTASSTRLQLVITPVGTFSVFAFTTPIPYPFGLERTGYLVTDLDVAIRAARAAGADGVVAPFKDPIGRDAVIQWPGGVNMQLYWHSTPPSYPSLQTIPENRVYVSPDRVDTFVRSFVGFSHRRVVSDDRRSIAVPLLEGSSPAMRSAISVTHSPRPQPLA